MSSTTDDEHKPVPANDVLPEKTSKGGDDAKPSETPKQAETIVQMVEVTAELFHDPRGTPYAAVQVALGDLPPVPHILNMRTRRYRAWVARMARQALGQTVSSRAIDEALIALEGIACFDRPAENVHVRVAGHHSAIYVHLADKEGQCIEVTGDGWHLTSQAPVRFAVPNGVRPLACPVSGGSIQELRPFVNVDDDGFILLVAWLVTSLRPELPCPALVVTGEQGTAKSTLCRLARQLIDPNVADLRSPPRNEDDLLIAAQNSRIVAFDNLSGLSAWLSDALCRLITGGGVGKRTLYSDEDENILEAKRPLLLNGIEDVAERPDLAERCIALTLAPIPIEKRRDEDTYWREFNAAAPRILGALLDGVASGLARIDGVQLETLPRMADFAKWTAAAEPGLGFPPGSIAAAYARNQALVVATALDASPVATALRLLLRKKGGEWAGTPTAFFRALKAFAPPDAHFSKSWPTTSGKLTGQLRRAATALRQAGIDVVATHNGRGRGKKRWLKICDRNASKQKATRKTEAKREKQ